MGDSFSIDAAGHTQVAIAHWPSTLCRYPFRDAVGSQQAVGKIIWIRRPIN